MNQIKYDYNPLTINGLAAKEEVNRWRRSAIKETTHILRVNKVLGYNFKEGQLYSFGVRAYVGIGSNISMDLPIVADWNSVDYQPLLNQYTTGGRFFTLVLKGTWDDEDKSFSIDGLIVK